MTRPTAIEGARLLAAAGGTLHSPGSGGCAPTVDLRDVEAAIRAGYATHGGYGAATATTLTPADRAALALLARGPDDADPVTAADLDPDTCYAPVGGGLHCGAPIGECEHTATTCLTCIEGRLPCTDCDGRGRYEVWPHVTCPTCKGAKTVPCEDCGGSGKLDLSPATSTPI